MALVNVDDSWTGRAVRKLRGINPELDIISKLALTMKEPPVRAPALPWRVLPVHSVALSANFHAPLHIDMGGDGRRLLLQQQC